MATKYQDPENFGIVNLQYGQLVLPIEDAITLFSLIGKAEKYELLYVPSKSEGGVTVDSHNEHRIGGTLPPYILQVLSCSDYLTGKLNGGRNS